MSPTPLATRSLKVSVRSVSTGAKADASGGVTKAVIVGGIGSQAPSRSEPLATEISSKAMPRWSSRVGTTEVAGAGASSVVSASLEATNVRRSLSVWPPWLAPVTGSRPWSVETSNQPVLVGVRRLAGLDCVEDLADLRRRGDQRGVVLGAEAEAVAGAVRLVEVREGEVRRFDLDQIDDGVRDLGVGMPLRSKSMIEGASSRLASRAKWPVLIGAQFTTEAIVASGTAASTRSTMLSIAGTNGASLLESTPCWSTQTPVSSVDQPGPLDVTCSVGAPTSPACRTACSRNALTRP